jgi:hypothetical protein
MQSQEHHATAAPRVKVDTETTFTETPRWSRYVNLTQQHRDLDCTISALIDTGDELMVARLKKRKLRLKDEIEHVAADLRASVAASS